MRHVNERSVLFMFSLAFCRLHADVIVFSVFSPKKGTDRYFACWLCTETSVKNDIGRDKKKKKKAIARSFNVRESSYCLTLQRSWARWLFSQTSRKDLFYFLVQLCSYSLNIPQISGRRRDSNIRGSRNVMLDNNKVSFLFYTF